MRNNLPKLSIKYEKVNVFNRNIKFLFSDDQWLLLRLSGTEPAFRVFTEFKYKEDSDILVKELKDYIENVQNEVSKEREEK